MLAIRCLKLAGLYLVLGMSLGIGMGIARNFSLAPVHAHINLLGWVSLGLAAAVFKLWPQAARTRLATAYFWTYNLSLPVAMASLAVELSGYRAIVPLVAASHMVLWLGGLMFVINLFLTFRAGAATAATAAVTTPGWESG